MSQTQFTDSILDQAFDNLQIKDLSNADAVATILDKFGLRWTVEKKPLMIRVKDEAGNYPYKPTGYFGIVRSDNHETFMTCTDQYKAFQNSELAELLVRIGDKTGYEIHNGGMLNGGKRIYVQLDTHARLENLGKNKTTVKGYLTALNSHDGSSPLKWGETNVTVCCRNTFAAAMRDMKNKARHTVSIHDKVEASIMEITAIRAQEEKLFERLKNMAEIPMNANHLRKIVQKVTTVDILVPEQEAIKQYSSYAVNRKNELLQSIASEMRQKGETMWGAFSGVTHYTSHVLPVPKRDNARTESKIMGSAAHLDNDAFTLISELSGLN